MILLEFQQMKRLDEYDQTAVGLANVAYNRIVQFHLERTFNTPKTGPPGGVLYHYTGADGLKGIIENDELWATSAYSLNDLAEITYGYGVLAEAVTRWVAKNSGKVGSLAFELASRLRAWFGEQLFQRQVVHPIYLACFCEEDNLLSQWRAYGQAGGYSIGFQVPHEKLVNRDFKPEPNIYTSGWVKVEYDRAEQLRRCDTILDALLVIFDDQETAAAIATVGDHPLFGYSKIVSALEDILLEETVGFKNEAFSVEKEWRIVVRRREFTKQATDDGGATPVPVHFRSSRGVLVPYVKLTPAEAFKKLPITVIRTGPTLDKTTSAMAVRMLLDKNGFKARVLSSDIPVRL